jgi:hypothetical protein
VIEFPNKWKWVSLNRESCNIEGSSMGHCGNAGYKNGDVIYSLRDVKNVPYLTFIINNGVLGESKGRFNSKPEKSFHPYIVKLLTSGIVKRIDGGGYAPENNFELSDLSNSDYKKVISYNPHIESMLEKYKYLDDKYLNDDYITLPLSDAIKIVKEFKDLYLLPSKQVNNNYYDYKIKNNKINLSPQTLPLPNERSSSQDELTFNIAKNTINKTALGKAWESLELYNKISNAQINGLVDEINNKHTYSNGSNLFLFLRKLSQELPKAFDLIYSSIKRKDIKSDIATYFVSTGTPLDDNKYYDISDKNVISIYNALKDTNQPIPEQIQKIADHIMHQNNQYNKDINLPVNKPISYQYNFMTEIIQELLNNKDVPLEKIKLFDKLSVIKLSLLRKITKNNIISDNDTSILPTILLDNHSYPTLTDEFGKLIYKLLKSKIELPNKFYVRIMYTISHNKNIINSENNKRNYTISKYYLSLIEEELSKKMIH